MGVYDSICRYMEVYGCIWRYGEVYKGIWMYMYGSMGGMRPGEGSGVRRVN